MTGLKLSKITMVMATYKFQDGGSSKLIRFVVIIVYISLHGSETG